MDMFVDVYFREGCISCELCGEEDFEHIKSMHHQKDARFLGDTIDFVVFDGLFPNGRIKEPIITETKYSSSRMNEVEKRVKKAVDKGKASFELIRVE